MLYNKHLEIKQLVIQSWKKRWPEEQWSCQVRKFISTPSDGIQLADALVSQAFVGSAPNMLLVRNVLVCLHNSLITYASVINAIAKHDELGKAESIKSMYTLLHKLLRTINLPGRQQLAEDSMALSVSLRIILQWLLRNAEHFFEAGQSVLTEMSCSIIDELTIQVRTSALLTIARFEESGPWSNIETDLAVIKQRSNGSTFSAKINATCHHVSQITKRSITQQASYVGVSQNCLVCPPIQMLITLEVECDRMSEIDHLVKQLLLLAKVCDLDHCKLLFSLYYAVLLCFADAPAHKGWLCMTFKTLPLLTDAMRSAVENQKINSSSGATHFCDDLFSAISKVIEFESLIDSIDQMRSDLNLIELLTGELNQLGLLSDIMRKNLCEQRGVHRQCMSSNSGVDHCLAPVLAVQADKTVAEVVVMLDKSNSGTCDIVELVAQLHTFLTVDRMQMVVAAAATSPGLLKQLTSSLQRCNDHMRFPITAGSPPAASPNNTNAETGKQMHARQALFDVTFLMLAYIAQKLGSSALLKDGQQQQSAYNVNNFVAGWLEQWWPCRSVDEKIVGVSAMGVDSNVVENLIMTMRNSVNGELKHKMSKWHVVCANLPTALVEFLNARQRGVIGSNEIESVCRLMRLHFPLAAALASINALCRTQHGVPHAVYVGALRFLTEEQKTDDSNAPLYHTRHHIYSYLAHHLTKTLLPPGADDDDQDESDVIKTFDAAFTLSVRDGWVSPVRYRALSRCLARMGVASFVERTCGRILEQVGLSLTCSNTEIAYTLVSMQPEPMSVYLLRYLIPKYIRQNPHRLVEPNSGCLARLLVANLDFALNEVFNLQKSAANGSVMSSSAARGGNLLDPFLYDPSLPGRQGVGGSGIDTRLRRMLSCSTEHDLAPTGVGLPPNEPLVQVLYDFICFLSTSLCAAIGCQKGPHADFAFHFVRLALRSSPLLSRTVKELVPSELLRSIGARLASEDLGLLFAAADLGNSQVRRIAADAILFSCCRTAENKESDGVTAT